MFVQATIVIPVYDNLKKDFGYDCYNIGHLDSPAVQRRLEDIEEYNYLRIANLGLLLVKDVTYTSIGGIVLSCRLSKKYEQKESDNNGEQQNEKKAFA